MSVPARVDSDEILTPVEAAQELKIPSPRTLERWRTNGTGPAFVRLGRRVAYTRGALRQFVQLNTKNSTSEE
jgi:hypothetical protein